jgi:hypothetical protein
MEIIKKYKLVFSIVLILLIAIGGSFIVKKVNNAKLPVSQENIAVPTPNNNLPAEVATPIDNVSSTTKTLPETEKVKLTINTGEAKHEFSSSLEKDATVFSLLKKLSAANNYTLVYKESSIGVFIEELYGVKNNATQNKYWLYKVNGESANVGASSYQLKAGDIVEWNFEEAKGF